MRAWIAGLCFEALVVLCLRLLMCTDLERCTRQAWCGGLYGPAPYMAAFTDMFFSYEYRGPNFVAQTITLFLCKVELFTQEDTLKLECPKRCPIDQGTYFGGHRGVF
jgi:hypothetical protein